MALTLAGFDVREVGDGYDALRQLESEPPDLVVLDLGLPRVPGRTVLEDMAAKPQTREIPIVIVTASTGPEIDQLKTACTLTKPVSPERLVDRAEVPRSGRTTPEAVTLACSPWTQATA
jgi:DNA-binding response OmpR family regulator